MMTSLATRARLPNIIRSMTNNRLRPRALCLATVMLLAASGYAADRSGKNAPPPPPAPTAPSVPAPAPTPAPGATAPATEPVRPKAGGLNDVLTEVDWSAVKQSFVEEKDAVVLTGSAWVRYKGTKLEADNIVFFRQTREIYAEGNVRLRIGESEAAAQAMYVDVNTDAGYLIDAVMRVSAPPRALSKKGGGKDRDKDRERQPADSRTAIIPDDKPAGSFLGPDVLSKSRDPYGTYLMPEWDPQARTNFIFKAEKIVKQGRLLYTAENAFMTSDDMVHPMYGVRVKQLDFYLTEENAPTQDLEKVNLKPQKIIARQTRIEIMGVPLFPFPTISYDLNGPQSFYETHYGHSNRWGYFALNRWGYNLTSNEDKAFDPTRIYFDADVRTHRGAGLGFELDWQSGGNPPEGADKQTRGERGMGHIQGYGLDEFETSVGDDLARARRNLERRIQPKIEGFPRQQYDANLLFLRRRAADNAGPPSFVLRKHENDLRGTIDFQQHQPLRRILGVDNLLLDLKYQRQSDRDFMQEYFTRDYLSQGQPEALASLRKVGDNYSLELLYRGNPQDFDAGAPRSPVNYGTFTDYQPALTYSLASMPIPGGFYMRSEMQAARLQREFERDIYDQGNINADRAYGIIDFARPFRWSAFNIVPHLGTQQQVYDDSRGGGSISQGALTYGFDITTRSYGTFPDFENAALGLENGMRHIIEPRLSYRGVSDTQTDPVKIYDFDQIDDLTAIDTLTLALDQTFQTRRAGKPGEGLTPYNFAGLNMAIDFYPRRRDQERLLHGDAQDLFRTDGYIRVLDTFRLGAAVGIRPENCTLETASYSITIDPQTRWRLRFEERYNYQETMRAIYGSDQYRVRLDYQLSERWGVMLEEIVEQRNSLMTRRGQQLQRIGITRSYGPLDMMFTYSVDRNLGDHSVFFSMRPVASYRNVVVPSQDLLVGQAEVSGETETPEERNFDPFELLRKQKKKPIVPVRERDVPLPALPTGPAPAPSGNTLAPGSGPKLAQKPASPAAERRVDDDDWTGTR